MPNRAISRREWMGLIAASSAAAADVSGVPFAVIVNAEVPAGDLRMIDLKKIYLGDRQFWTSDLRIVPLIRAPQTRERIAVLWGICRMNEAQFGQYWIAKMMRAECTASPRQFPNNQVAVHLVNSMPGAIAVINAAQLPPSGVKVLKIEGQMPSDASYKLQIGGGVSG